MTFPCRLSGLLLTLSLAAGPALAQTTTVTTTTQAASPMAMAMMPPAPNPPAFNAPQTPDAIESAMLQGIAYAKSQLAAGHFETMRIGPPPSPQENAHIIAIERQGVSVIQLGDVLSAGLVAYADANNAIMDAAIRQKYGPDFWDRVEQQAPMPADVTMGR